METEKGDFLDTKPRLGHLEYDVAFLAASEEKLEACQQVGVVISTDTKDSTLQEHEGRRDSFWHETWSN